MLALLAALSIRPEQNVTIRYNEPAKSVAFAGDLNLWNPAPMNDTGQGWVAEFKLPNDARFEYKFVVDQKWILDPANDKKIGNGIGGENSVYEGPGYHAAAYPEVAPHLPMTRIHMTVAGRAFDVFSPAKSRKAPIMVYGDGESYLALAHIQNVYANLIASRKIRPVVLVLVPPKDRMNEYGAGYSDYAKLLFDSILPLVRQATQASDRAEDLYIGGSSMGGVIALRLAEEYPKKVRGGVQSQSGAFQYEPPNVRYESVMTPGALRKVAARTKLWLDWGNFESTLTKANEAATKTLKERKRQFGSMVTNEGHNWTAWRNRMVPGVTYLFSRR